ncbi:Na+/H+ antiporter NhaC [Lentisphaerota bacterium ZTH]|nr:Na+/H+ antiporter NhaC [Lentisphaerota bacterium]WET07080.1 Na+/H+ antiporter NhaC [Lentisphaerota bacterium ZTH]
MCTNKAIQPRFYHALIPVVFLAAALGYTQYYAKQPPHFILFASGMIAAAVAVFWLKQKWSDLQQGMIESIKMSLEPIIILMVVSMVIATWIVSGIVPAMIFYGLKVLSPGIFLPASLIMCAIVSMASGSSWTTAATIGIALMAIGYGLGIPQPITAGAVISGGYMGDKLSPFSETTNLAPAMAGSKLVEHIRHMMYTTLPAFLIAVILFAIIGSRYSDAYLSTENINSVLNVMQQKFVISPFLLVVPAIILYMVIKKFPAIPGLFIGAFLGGLVAFFVQKASLSDILVALQSGYKCTSGNVVVDSLMSRGGLESMLSTIALILCAISFGGIMEKSGMLSVLANGILKIAKSTGQLIAATVITPLLVNVFAGDQYIAIIIPGRMFKSAYVARGLHPKNLSRTLEDSGTLLSPLIPWNSCGAFMIATLGLTPWTYVPYCFLNWLCPIIAIIYGFTGYSIARLNEEETTGKRVVPAEPDVVDDMEVEPAA